MSDYHFLSSIDISGRYVAASLPTAFFSTIVNKTSVLSPVYRLPPADACKSRGRLFLSNYASLLRIDGEVISAFPQHNADNLPAATPLDASAGPTRRPVMSALPLTGRRIRFSSYREISARHHQRRIRYLGARIN